MVAVIAYVMVSINQSQFETIVPFLGAFALAGQRIIPLMQRIYISITLIGVSIPQTKSILTTLSQDFSLTSSVLDDSEQNLEVKFNKEILLEGVNYTEPGGVEILKDISLKFEKNQIIGIKGKTGSGKTTLVNLILGLLKPTTGLMKCDDQIIKSEHLRNYQNMFALVSQDLEITSMDAKHNISFSNMNDVVDDKKFKMQLNLLTLSIFFLHQQKIPKVCMPGMKRHSQVAKSKDLA